MSQSGSLSSVLAPLLLLLFLVDQSSAEPSSAYEILQGYNLPKGLLPQGIVNYDLDESTGQFHAYWNGSCNFSLEGSYQLKYRSTISGMISKNKLTNLTGVSVKILFFWVNIVEVTRNGDELDFSVGIASAGFPIDNFYVSPQCGCGLNCVNGLPVTNLRLTNSFVSSV